MAAPQVTGATVLIKQKYPWMTNDNLRTTLLTTATDLRAKGIA
ncbi:S8 family serine peptidase [Snodgrassella communis]